ncbi:acyltransferase family protein [Lichenicoccus sp.]|uniref:acyltransferase family protein n=1 Tax=Lichenicoccus sp. TaxID=2781899 RepID=UPI003D0BFCD6
MPRNVVAGSRSTVSSAGRIKSLDSLRGVAALTVVFYHCFLLFPGSYAYHHSPFHGGARDLYSWFTRSPLCLAISGPAAVLVFFALSGLVLTFPLTRGQLVREYYVKRILRIWPPFAVAILFSVILEWFVQPGPIEGFGRWISFTWNEPLSAGLVREHLLLLGGTRNGLDNPMWSLTHEMRVSLIFPALVLAMRATPILTCVISVLMLGLAAVLPAHGNIITTQLAMTASYLFLFASGALLGLHLRAVRSFVAGLPAWASVTAWIFALSLTTLTPGPNSAVGSICNGVLLLVAGLGALAIVALCTTENRVTHCLETPFPSWLGRISYSLYLVHVPIIVGFAYSFPHADKLLLITAGIAVSVLAAEALNRLIETPSEISGRWLAHKLRLAKAGSCPRIAE